jgi:hypothetical protein
MKKLSHSLATSLEEQKWSHPQRVSVPPGNYDAGLAAAGERPPQWYWRHFGERAMLAGMQTTNTRETI